MRHRIPLLAALAAASCTTVPGHPVAGARAVPAALPPARVLTLDGAPTDLRAAIQGRAAFVDFWATWCDTCLSEIDAMKRLDAQTAGRRDALVVGVAVGEAPETVAAFARERRLGYLQLVDRDFALADALGQRRVPSTIVVDRAGRIVYSGSGLDSAALTAFRSAMRAASSDPAR